MVSLSNRLVRKRFVAYLALTVHEALCNTVADSEDIIHDTCGFIFLGTPHQGSTTSIFGAILAYITGFLGSNAMLLLSLSRNKSQLSDLDDRFMNTVKVKEQRGEKADMVSFHETKPTYLFDWLSIGLVSFSLFCYGFD